MADVYRPRDAGAGVFNVERFASDGTITVISFAFTEDNARLIAEQLQDAYDRGRYDEATERAEQGLRDATAQLKIDRARAAWHAGEGRAELADLLGKLLNDQPKPKGT